LHTGFSDEEIVRLSDEDNENDEYHKAVPCVDVWLSYKSLADAGWTQERIAKAKGVSQSQVAKRLQYSELPQSVLAIIQRTTIGESFVAELSGLFNLNNS
jgi:ParB-like chromosome segregation protein Spo0J